ncbi:senecionine N-oxygenase-like [Phymastichus coffea]|uniref:senecionine N-oxygenase-like n=1 Tax=Phymastichus coffea TaxID=108790 RepID=UPI00273C0D47|nr:senecionine N-oxygenase-like [Phymastichus coffea]
MISHMNPKVQLLLLLIVGVYGKAQLKKKVCIIGGGVSGLISVKQLSRNLNNIETIVFEQASDIGGQWKYTDSTDVDEHGLPVHSSVYKNLRANGPKVLMSFPDYQEFHGENRSYVKHETVLEYLKNYTAHFNLRQYIKFDTFVKKVSYTDDKKWRVETQDLNLDKSEDYTCDAVVVCNGHFTRPYSPIIPGLSNFTGRTLHSHLYRKPEEFTNKTIVILGASYSGIDIGIELSNFAKTVYLSHRHSRITSELPENMIQIPGVVAVNGTDLILNEGSRIKADAFIICTGYLYDYPFLDESTGITVTKGKYVHPLYKHFININHPTMVFVGLPHPGFPFLVPYIQTQYFVSLLRGKAKLPARAEMLKESQLPPGTPATKAHFMEEEVLDYYDDLAKAADIEPLSDSLKRAALIYVDDKNKDVLHFKENELIIRGDGHVALIRPSNATTKIDYGY